MTPPRVRYGDELAATPDGIPCGGATSAKRAADGLRCHDCNAHPGEYHVPGCDAEQCPACRWQAIACWCYDPSEDA